MDLIEVLPESANWRSREVTYLKGTWDLLRKQVPEFELGPFQSEGAPVSNPFYKTVFRKPRTPLEHRIPVGIVSNTYTLAQHTEVAELCLEGLRQCGIPTADLVCELGLSTLGEWMNFRVILPSTWIFEPGDSHPLTLRLECSNSVEGGCSLEILLGWYRLVCSNGLVVKDSARRIRETHDSRMDMGAIRDMVGRALEAVGPDQRRLRRWVSLQLDRSALEGWIDGPLSTAWGRGAAFRVFHICESGQDADFADPFEAEVPSKKAATNFRPVPGSPQRATSIYDVSQALSWVATHRRNPEERGSMLTSIPAMLGKLDARAAAC